MTNLLITHAYLMPLDPKQWRGGRPYPPLGTLYAASALRERGYAVKFFDTMFSASPEGLSEQIAISNPDIIVIYDDGFNYLTKMCLANMREAAFRMIALGKANDCQVIVCNSDASDHYDQYLKAGADFVIIGEGEHTLVELVGTIRREAFGSIDTIAGLAYKKQGVVSRTPPRAVMRDLDALPLPAWDLVDMGRYRSCWMDNAGYFSLNVTTTRGCPFKCNWCAKPIYGNRYNSRSPAHVIGELKLLKEKYGCSHLWFPDDIFGLKPGWVKAFADLAAAEKLGLKFKIQSRADLLLQPDYVRDLARAGCDTVWMGAESGSQKILDAMDKGITVAEIEKATALLKHYGIRPCFFIQFGYPGETKEDIAQTVGMINRLLPAEIGISVSYPLPGTPFYERVRAELKEKSHWNDSDELYLMFKNTYSPSYYKQLHHYVHKSYRGHLALRSLRAALRPHASSDPAVLKKICSLLYFLPVSFLSKQKLNLIALADTF